MAVGDLVRRGNDVRSVRGTLRERAQGGQDPWCRRRRPPGRAVTCSRGHPGAGHAPHPEDEDLGKAGEPVDLAPLLRVPSKLEVMPTG